MENEVRLIDAPVGLFKHGKCLGLKTEYMINNRVEAYVVESGEIFWGGVNTDEEVNNLLVTPIDPERLRPKGRWELQEYCWSEAWKCSVCGEEWCFEYDPTEPAEKVNYCPNCGAKMEG